MSESVDERRWRRSARDSANAAEGGVEGEQEDTATSAALHPPSHSPSPFSSVDRPDAACWCLRICLTRCANACGGERLHGSV